MLATTSGEVVKESLVLVWDSGGTVIVASLIVRFAEQRPYAGQRSCRRLIVDVIAQMSFRGVRSPPRGAELVNRGRGEAVPWLEVARCTDRGGPDAH